MKAKVAITQALKIRHLTVIEVRNMVLMLVSDHELPRSRFAPFLPCRDGEGPDDLRLFIHGGDLLFQTHFYISVSMSWLCT